MINKVHQLDSDLINQIAAGEVIDRPASIVKELIENSLDANANKIDVEIIHGGHDLIQVSDNGCGMNKNDLRLAFRRHATSKIKHLDDLNQIETLGFRGEALPSIASISKMSARSSEDGEKGYEIKVDGGDEKSLMPSPVIKVIIFKVKNLFYNTPARRKFLKKPVTEQAYINKVIRRFMLCRPDVSFKMMSNNKLVYHLPIQNLSERIIGIYGTDYANGMLPVTLDKDPYSISGFAGNLSIIRKRQGEQYLFLNGRFIHNRLLNSAVYSAYQSLVKRGEFPFFTLFLDVPNHSFDVNVHPAKLEVRFKNEWQIYHIIKSAVSMSLTDIIKVIPEYSKYDLKSKFDSQNEISLPLYTQQHSSTYIEDVPPHKNITSSYDDHNELIEKAHARITLKEEDTSSLSNDFQSVTDYIWQIHNKYLITEIKSGLIIIDQHVAHERILFEEAKKAMTGKGFTSQTILFPQTIKFQPEEFKVLIEITYYLEKIGFRFREFGENTIIIEGIPSDIRWGNENQIIREIIDQYISVRQIDPSFIDQISAIYACKSAIKAGDPLKEPERKNLLDRLFSTDHPYYCPHGRPIIINLSINELDERFERH